jgi:predicted nucleotidyltransferase
MRRDEALRILKEHEQELRDRGVVHLRIFGSVARDEATPHSDVDVLADFDPSMRISLVTLGSLEHRLSVLLATPVDLSSTKWLRPHIRQSAQGESVDAF